MKQPKSKLPFDLSDMGEYGFHITTQKSDGGELITDAFCDENDVKYLHQAANNFPEAVNLLKIAKEAIEELTEFQDGWNEDLEKIKEFLNKIHG